MLARAVGRRTIAEFVPDQATPGPAGRATASTSRRASTSATRARWRSCGERARCWSPTRRTCSTAAFFALPDSIKGADGEPVNALLGSVNQTLWCVERYKPRAVVMCFGQDSADYRVEAFPAYHADRPPMPDALAAQWEKAPALYEALGWTVMTPRRARGRRPDALAVRRRDRGGRAARYILTGDRDMFQCANETVRVLMQVRAPAGPGRHGPGRGGRALRRHARAGAGLHRAARRPVRRAARARRASAPKTAADLLKRKGDLEHVILGAIREKPSVRRALIEQADELRSFRDIATLRTVPVDRPPDTPTDYAGGAAAAAELGMGRALEAPAEEA